MLGIGWWDWGAILLYLGGITCIGIWAARKVKDTADFFMGGRRFGKAFMVFFAFGAGTNGNQADQAVGRSEDVHGRYFGHLVSMALAFCHAILLDHRAVFSPDAGHHHGRLL